MAWRGGAEIRIAFSWRDGLYGTFGKQYFAVIVHPTYLFYVFLFRAPCDHLTPSSTKTNPDTRRRIWAGRATRNSNSGNSVGRTPAPPAGQFTKSVSRSVIGTDGMISLHHDSLAACVNDRMSSVAASGRYRRQSTRGHSHRYSKRHRSADATRLVCTIPENNSLEIHEKLFKTLLKIAGETENPWTISSQEGDRSRVLTI